MVMFLSLVSFEVEPGRHPHPWDVEMKIVCH